MRHMFVAIVAVAAWIASIAEANDQFRVVLHAQMGEGSCTAPGLPDCDNVRPTTQIAKNSDYTFYIFVNNYNDIQALQTAFSWPNDWLCDPDGEPPVIFGCRAHQVNVSEPQNPGGSMAGTLATAFDCVLGPTMVLIGRMDFFVGGEGCLSQINPFQGTGRVEIVDCQNHSYVIDASDPVQNPRLGAICAGMPGYDACDWTTSVEPHVESVNWGRIKMSYH